MKKIGVGMFGELSCRYILYYLRDILRRSYSTARGIRVNNKLYYYIRERVVLCGSGKRRSVTTVYNNGIFPSYRFDVYI